MAVMTAVAVGTMAVGAYSANQQGKASDRASRRAAQSADAQVQLGYDQLDFSERQYADWQERFNPIMDELTMMAREGSRPDYSAIAADVGQAFGAQQAMARRQQERFGIKPTDGMTAANDRQFGIGRALALVGGNQSARTQAKDQQFGRLAGVYGMGNGQMSAAMSGMNAGYGNTMGALGNQSAMFANQANQYSAAAAAGAQGFGYGLGMLGQAAGGWGGGGYTGATTSIAGNAAAGGINLGYGT